MFRTKTTYFIQCNKCNKTYGISGETLKKYVVPNTATKPDDIIKSPFRGNLNKLACYDGWQILEPDGHLCPNCRKDKIMHKYVTIGCYYRESLFTEDEPGYEFIRTRVFETDTDDYAIVSRLGEEKLYNEFPNEIDTIRGVWTLSADNIVKEAEKPDVIRNL